MASEAPELLFTQKSQCQSDYLGLGNFSITMKLKSELKGVRLMCAQLHKVKDTLMCVLHYKRGKN